MTWVKTIPLSEANENLLHALELQRSLYPKEYATPVFRTDDGVAGIMGSHSLIPDALYHAFSTFGGLMSPELPLARRQHEMIATRTLRSASTLTALGVFLLARAGNSPMGCVAAALIGRGSGGEAATTPYRMLLCLGCLESYLRARLR